MAYRSLTNLTYQSGQTTAPFVVPTGAAAGDIAHIYLWIQTETTSITVVPSGFTQKVAPLSIGGAQSGKMVHYWKRLVAGDLTGPWSFTFGNSTGRQGWAVCHSGRLAEGDPWEFAVGYVTPSGTETQPGILTGSTPAAGSDLVYSAEVWSGSAMTLTDSPAWTSRLGTGDGNNCLTKDNQAASEPGNNRPDAITATTWWAIMGALAKAGVAPLVRSTGAILTGGTATSAVLNTPSGIASADTGVAVIFKEAAGAITPADDRWALIDSGLSAGGAATGYTMAVTSGTQQGWLYVFLWTAHGIAPASWTFSFGSTWRNGWSAAIQDTSGLRGTLLTGQAAPIPNRYSVTSTQLNFNATTTQDVTPAVSLTHLAHDLSMMIIGSWNGWASGIDWAPFTRFVVRQPTADRELAVATADQPTAGTISGLTIDTGRNSSLMAALIAFKPAVTGQTIAVGRATETDTAKAVGHYKILHPGRATETDTAGVTRPQRIKSVGRATETDTAHAVTHSRAVVVQITAESDLAYDIKPRKLHAISGATETDTAGGVTPVFVRRIAAGVATETDTAGNILPSRAGTLGMAVETDTAGVVKPVHTSVVNRVEEIDTAHEIKPIHRVLVGRALETDTARIVSFDDSLHVAVGRAVESNTASAFSMRRTYGLGRAQELDTARQIRPQRTETVGRATETYTARAITPLLITGSYIITIWDGTQEVSAILLGEWDGTAIQPLAFEGTT